LLARSPCRKRWLLPVHLLLSAVAGIALFLPACATWDGHFSILGYTTQPNYDLRFKTISVQVFRNRTPWTVTPAVGMEMDLTRAIVREIELKTPYKVVSCDGDTELRGSIMAVTKGILNYNPLNEIREGETTMVVELIWRDRRTGEVLTKAPRRPGAPREEELREPLLAPGSVLPPGSRPIGVPTAPTPETTGGFAPDNQVEEEIIDPQTRKKAVPVIVRSVAQYRPELGESLTTAFQKNIDRLAVQIVFAMEKGW
jgi:Lipopolysaccharide-assembly